MFTAAKTVAPSSPAPNPWHLMLPSPQLSQQRPATPVQLQSQRLTPSSWVQRKLSRCKLWIKDSQPLTTLASIISQQWRSTWTSWFNAECTPNHLWSLWVESLLSITFFLAVLSPLRCSYLWKKWTMIKRNFALMTWSTKLPWPQLPQVLLWRSMKQLWRLA